MRYLKSALAATAILAAGCHRSGNGSSATTPTPAGPPVREAKYVQIDLAVNPGATVDALAKGTLAPCGDSRAIDRCWKADAKFFPGLAAAEPPITLQAYPDEGAISFAFSGAAAQYAQGGNELPKLLAALCARAESAGGSLYQTDDDDGSTVGVAAVAGHDAAQAAMALVDVWYANLDVAYGFGPGDDPTAPTRASLVETLRRSTTLEDRLKRFPGTKLERSEGGVLVRFADPNADTHDLAASIAHDELRDAASPRSAGTSGD